MIELEILNYNYWETFKYRKDLALVLPVDHPKLILLDKQLNELIIKIHDKS